MIRVPAHLFGEKILNYYCGTTKNTCYFILMGGLGNQMFQYAAGQSVAKRHSCDVVYIHRLSTRWSSNTCSRVNVPYELGNFGINAHNFLPSAQGNRLTYLLKLFYSKYVLQYFFSKFNYTHEIDGYHCAEWLPFYDIKPPQIACGYWQVEKYFTNVEQEIRECFALEKVASDKAKELAKVIKNTKNSVSVHVRLNDYVFLGFNLDSSYFLKARRKIEEFVTPETYFVFSDDLAGAKRMFADWDNTVFIDCKETIFDDLYLMHLCNHNIIANSSYSWWAAWLNENKEKILILPKDKTLEEDKGILSIKNAIYV